MYGGIGAGCIARWGELCAGSDLNGGMLGLLVVFGLLGLVRGYAWNKTWYNGLDDNYCAWRLGFFSFCNCVVGLYCVRFMLAGLALWLGDAAILCSLELYRELVHNDPETMC